MTISNSKLQKNTKALNIAMEGQTRENESLLVYIFSGAKQHICASISEKIWEKKILASFQ